MAPDDLDAVGARLFLNSHLMVFTKNFIVGFVLELDVSRLRWRRVPNVDTLFSLH